MTEDKTTKRAESKTARQLIIMLLSVILVLSLSLIGCDQTQKGAGSGAGSDAGAGSGAGAGTVQGLAAVRITRRIRREQQPVKLTMLASAPRKPRRS